MVGGCCTCLPDGSPTLPSESKLESGNVDLSTREEQPKHRSTKPQRVLNRVGRRHQLAAELVQQVPWMTRAAVPRIAWVVRHVADAGWTANEVIAWLELAGAAEQVRRPSAYLAYRMRGAVSVWDSESKRASGVQAWRDTARSTAERHVEWDVVWTPPTRVSVARAFAHGLASPVYQPSDGDADTTWHSEDDPVVELEEYTPAQILDLRTVGRQAPALVWRAIQDRGEAYARRLYTHQLVEYAVLCQHARPTA
jgi:hypothetical protein